MKKVTIIIIFILSCLAGSQSQILPLSSRRTNEITYELACAKATTFLAGLGFQNSPVEKSRARIFRMSRGSFYSLNTKSGFWIEVDTTSGRIRTARNMKRRNEQYRKQNRTGDSMFSSEASAKNRLRLVATQCGVPSHATLVNFGWKRDGEVKDANSAGTVWGNYKLANEAYHLSIDPQDGVLVSFQHLER